MIANSFGLISAEDDRMADAEAWAAELPADHPASILLREERERGDRYRLRYQRRRRSDSQPAPIAAPVTTAAAETAKAMLDTTVVDRWASERKAKAKTVDAHRAVARWLYDRVGRVSVAELTRAHVIAFKDKRTRPLC